MTQGSAGEGGGGGKQNPSKNQLKAPMPRRSQIEKNDL